MILLSPRLAAFSRTCKGSLQYKLYLFWLVWSSELWVHAKKSPQKKTKILSCSLRTERKIVSTFYIHSKWGRFLFKERVSWSGMGSKIYEALSQKVVIWKPKWPTWCLSNAQFMNFCMSWCLDILRWQIKNFPLLLRLPILFVCCSFDWLIVSSKICLFFYFD